MSAAPNTRSSVPVTRCESRPCSGAASDANLEAPVKAGFGRASLKGCFAEEAEYHDDLEARVVYLEQGDRRVVLIAFDLVQPSRFMSREVREGVARKVGLSPEVIITHATHTHTSPFDPAFRKLGLEPLVERAAAGVREAMGRSRECTIAFAQADVHGRFSVNRRKEIAGVGTFSVFYGYDVKGRRADGAQVVRSQIEGLLGGPARADEAPGRLWFDRKVDGLVQLISIQSPEGEAVGSLLRFAVHPVVSGHVSAHLWKYGADIPGFARRAIEEEMDGACIYLSGPHGNIAPLEEVEWRRDEAGKLVHVLPGNPWAEAERLGRGIASAALARRRDLVYAPLDRLELATAAVSLPLRQTLRPTPEKWKPKAEELQRELETARARGAPLAELKRIADLRSHYGYHRAFFDEYFYLTQEEVARRQVACDLAVIRLNDVILVGLPGEAFMETGDAIRDQFPGARLVTLTEVNGDIGYLPPAEEFPGGAYEVNCSIIAPDAEEKLREAAAELVARVLG